jgi:predicted nucleic acid-binding protein
VNRYPHDVLADRIWELRHNASTYDAAYLALAEALGAPLLTSDDRLRGVPYSDAAIELI